MLKNINASTGPISHASTGASATQMKNLATSVFTAVSSVGVEDLMTLDVAVYPNPAQRQITIYSPMQNVVNQEIIIANMLGQVVLKTQKSGETLQLPLSLSAGNYMVSIAENGKTIGREKLVIVE
jgi:Secretion system C-terminal sorting domain